MHMLLQDFRFAWRALRHRPAFTAAAVLTLALGIGATTAIFSIVDTVMLKPLAYDQPERLYAVHEVDPRNVATMPLLPVNALHFGEWRTHARSFDGMALIGTLDVNLAAGGQAERIAGARVSPALLPMLGVRPLHGRLLRDDEDVPGRQFVVLLGHDLWQRRFGGDAGVVGRTVDIDGYPHTVVGVLPDGFALPRLSHLYGVSTRAGQPQFYTPFAATDFDLRLLGRHNHAVIARLKPGVSADAARAELNTIQAATLQQAPERPPLETALVSLQEQIVGRSRAALQLILAAVAMVLLIACVNIANMLLAQSIQRRREMSIRRAAGATRGRILWQLLAEGLVLSTAGGVLGVVIAFGILRVVLLHAPVDVPRLDDVGLDARVLLFAAAASWAAGLLVAAMPAWQLSGADAAEAMRLSRHGAASPATERARALLVATEVGVSTICLIVGALLLASFVNLLRVDGGFSSDQVVTVEVFPPAARYESRDRQNALRDAMLARLRQVPGIVAAGIGDRVPVSGQLSGSGVAAEGKQTGPWATVDEQAADPGYFEALRIPVRSGRVFEALDRGRRRVAVISERTASILWPGEDAVGKRFVDDDAGDAPLIEVVGVVADVRTIGLADAVRPVVYLPYWDAEFAGYTLVARTSGDPRALTTAIRGAIQAVDPAIAVPPLRTMDEVVAASVAQRRFQMSLVLTLAAAALLLAALGIYGVVAHWVAQRTSEIGIRMAIGAEPARVRLMVLRQTLVPVTAGVAGGIIAALALGRVLRGQLFEVSPADLPTYAGAAVFLLALALAASYLPARRATRIDPVVALRAE